MRMTARAQRRMTAPVQNRRNRPQQTAAAPLQLPDDLSLIRLAAIPSKGSGEDDDGNLEARLMAGRG